MNIVTIDIEEWYLEKTLHGNRKEFMQLYDTTLNKLLEVFASADICGTFFCVGQMAKHFPEVIRKITDAGHEIGCHSNVHTWLDKMTPEECMEDTRIAVDELEQCIGRKVVSYRAPAFSITQKNPWAFEALVTNGIQYDASVFPADRDFGGFRNFGADHPCIVSYKGMQIKEFPICPTRFFGRDLVYSGGGYFRLLPESFIQKEMSHADYVMMYFHISDLASVKTKFMSQKSYEEYYKEPGNSLHRLKRYLKDNLAWGNTFEKFQAIVKSVELCGIAEADAMIDWGESKKINLSKIKVTKS